MLKTYSKFFILSILFISLNAQTTFNEAEFIKNVRSKYHQIDNPNNDEITSELTSVNFQRYLSEKTNEVEKFPLIVNWTKPNVIQIKKTNYDLETSDYATTREQLILLARNFIINWSEFGVKKQIPDSAMNYTFSTRDDRVFFSYVFPGNKGYHRVSKEFGLNGILLKVEMQLENKESISMTPRFQDLGNKLLLYGWLYQKKDQNGNITEGNEVDIKYKIVNEHFYPENVSIKVQVASAKNKMYVEQLQFRNYKLNDEEM